MSRSILIVDDDLKTRNLLKAYLEKQQFEVRSAPDGATVALHDLLVALGRRLPTDRPPVPQPRPEPVAELVLELSDLGFHEHNGVRRPAARARLVYEPAIAGQREVVSEQSWRLIAPLGPIEAEELRWYLERWPVWPRAAQKFSQVPPAGTATSPKASIP